VFAESASMTFRAGFFYANHMALPEIILLLALYFFVSGAVSPLAYLLFNRSSMKVLFSLVAILNVVSYVMLSPSSTSLALAIISMVFSGSACGLYYPVSDVLESMYVTNHLTAAGR
jgi:hypothetical protein